MYTNYKKTKVVTWHSCSTEESKALEAIGATHIEGVQYETDMELFEAVRVLSSHCRTVGIFSDENNENHWIAITSYRNFNQR